MTEIELLEKLRKIVEVTPNSTHYLSFSRTKGKWIFRFQNIHIKSDEGRFYETAFFEGGEVKDVLVEAIKFLKRHKKDLKAKVLSSGVETKVISNSFK